MYFKFKMFFRKSDSLWANVEKYGTARKTTDDNIIRRMRFPCCITKDANTRSEFVILIDFPLQQWLQELISVLRYTYIARVVYETWRIIGEEGLV
jgi:hypothetical protein